MVRLLRRFPSLKRVPVGDRVSFVYDYHVSLLTAYFFLPTCIVAIILSSIRSPPRVALFSDFVPPDIDASEPLYILS